MIFSSEKRRLAMNEVESQVATAQELVAFAKQRGIDLSSTFYDWSFLNEGRFILLWRKEGKILYNMQGPVKVLPERLKSSADVFRGMWGETGSLETIEQAFEFVKAWLLDQSEVDELPHRSVRSYGI
jgi:hypothetical protein